MGGTLPYFSDKRYPGSLSEKRGVSLPWRLGFPSPGGADMRRFATGMILMSQAVVSSTVMARGTVKPSMPVSTFSIVASDPATGELGVAVQSHWFSVGS